MNKNPPGAVRRTQRTTVASRWSQYEAEKRAWLAANPEASAFETFQAMQRIARRLGV